MDSFGKPLHELLDDLTDSMRHAPGVGLAAPQLGEPLRACVIEVESHLYELVNPEIVRADRRRPRPRGLPVDPGLRGLRHAQGEGLGRRPEPRRQEDQGRRARASSARALQHELDHLDGKLYIDYLDSMDELIPVEPARGRGRGNAGVAANARRPMAVSPPPTTAASGRSSSAAAPSPSPPSQRSPRTRSSASSASSRAPPTPGRPAAGVDADARSRPPRAASTSDPVLTPPRLRAPEAIAAILALRPDLAVLADYGQIVPAAAARPAARRAQPPPVALPRFRGAAPIPAAILAGDAETAVTLMRMDAGLDTGPIVAQATVPLDGHGDRARARARLAALGGGPARAGRSPAGSTASLPAVPQADDGVVLTRPLRREDGRLDATRAGGRAGARRPRLRSRGRARSSSSAASGSSSARRRVAPSEPGDAPGAIVRDGGEPGARDRRRPPRARTGDAGRRPQADAAARTGSAAAATRP